jgi:dihydroflavonol-4-reductase
MARVLVTGATGFLGAHLVANLLERGDTVVALCRGAGPEVAVKGRTAEIASGDVLDADSVKRAAVGCDGVYHCAGKVSRDTRDAEELHLLHVEGTKRTLDACKAAGVRRAVIASSSGTVAVSADEDNVATEKDDAPVGILNRWPYYRSKLFAEQVALERNVPGFAVVSVNPTLLLGPGDLRGSSTEDVRLFLERSIPAVPPGGISYVDVRDAAEGMVLAMERGTPGARYLLGASNLTIREFFARLERISGVKAPLLPLPRAPELSKMGTDLADKLLGRFGLALPVDPVSFDMAQFYWYLDASLAEAELGWFPRDAVETLADTVRDLQERGVVWPEPDFVRKSSITSYVRGGDEAAR